MPLGDALFLPVRRVEQAHHSAFDSHSQARAVRTESQAGDPGFFEWVAGQLPTASRVPDAHGPVVGARCKQRPIRAERHTGNVVRMTRECTQVLVAEPPVITPFPVWGLFAIRVGLTQQFQKVPGHGDVGVF